MIKENFAVFILTHGRPDNVITYNTIKKSGYTGKIFIVIDNEDKKQKEYIERFKEEVVVFDKKEISKRIDEADNFNDRRAILYARNACFEIAEKLGIEYFIQFDDDYTSFRYLYNENLEFKRKKINNLDDVINCFLKFYIENKNIDTIAFLQGGDLIGGEQNTYLKSDKYPFIKRKAMNSFICSIKRKFLFSGRINEDVNAYTRLGGIGKLFLSIPLVMLTQKQTQTNSGGMTDIYKERGTYIKSFYSIIHCPSSVKIAMMGDVEKRIHHSINWENTIPKIIDEKHKKR